LPATCPCTNRTVNRLAATDLCVTWQSTCSGADRAACVHPIERQADFVQAATNRSLPQLTITDPDGGSGIAANAQLTYTIVGASSLFQVDSTTGTVAVQAGVQLDFEVRPRHTVTVRATDGAAVALFADTTVIINLIDLNDEPSFFATSLTDNTPQLLYQATVSEVDPVGTRLFRLLPRDRDSSPDFATNPPVLSRMFRSGRDFAITDGFIVRIAEPLDRDRRTNIAQGIPRGDVYPDTTPGLNDR